VYTPTEIQEAFLLVTPSKSSAEGNIPLAQGKHGAFLGPKHNRFCILHPSGSTIQVIKGIRNSQYQSTQYRIPASRVPVNSVWRTPLGRGTVMLMWETKTNALFYASIDKRSPVSTTIPPELVVVDTGNRPHFAMTPHERIIQVQ
jgi:hypothetical protein